MGSKENLKVHHRLLQTDSRRSQKLQDIQKNDENSLGIFQEDKENQHGNSLRFIPSRNDSQNENGYDGIRSKNQGNQEKRDQNQSNHSFEQDKNRPSAFQNSSQQLQERLYEQLKRDYTQTAVELQKVQLDCENQHAENSLSQKKLKEQSKMLAELQQDVVTLANELQLVQSQNEVLRNHIEEIQEDFFQKQSEDEYERKSRQETSDTNHFQGNEAIVLLKEANAALEEQLNEAKREYCELEEHAQMLQRNLKELEFEKNQQNIEEALLKKSQAQLEIDYEEMQNLNLNMQEQNKKLGNLVVCLENKTQKYEEELRREMSANQQIKGKIKFLTDELAKYEQIINQNMTEIEGLKRENTQLKTKYKGINSKLHDCEKDNQTLRQKLNENHQIEIELSESLQILKNQLKQQQVEGKEQQQQQQQQEENQQYIPQKLQQLQDSILQLTAQIANNKSQQINHQDSFEVNKSSVLTNNKNYLLPHERGSHNSSFNYSRQQVFESNTNHNSQKNHHRNNSVDGNISVSGNVPNSAKNSSNNTNLENLLAKYEQIKRKSFHQS